MERVAQAGVGFRSITENVNAEFFLIFLKRRFHFFSLLRLKKQRGRFFRERGAAPCIMIISQKTITRDHSPDDIISFGPQCD